MLSVSCKKSGDTPNIPPPVTPKPTETKPLPAITSFSPITGSVDTVVTITGAHFNTDISRDTVEFNGTKAVIKSATETQLIVIVPSGATTGKITIIVDTSKVASVQDFTVHLGNLWTLITRLPGTFMQFMTSFQIGNKMYIGLGEVYPGSLPEFWEYDFSSGVWTQKANYPAKPRPGEGIAFSVGNKGYVIMSPDSLLYPAIWEYDPALNQWTAKGYCPQNHQQGMIAFTIGQYAYIGPGGQGDSNTRRVWRYDPVANSWTRKSDYPGAATILMTSFTIGQYAFVGTGTTGIFTSTGSKEFYRYDPSTDSWTRKADFPGDGRNAATGFAIGNFGYLGTGANTTGFYVSDFWRYDPQSDSWKQISFFGGGYRASAMAFSGSQQGYVGFGLGPEQPIRPGGESSVSYIDLWQYQP
jgi:N-acetylneuraminic acid mutarotase